MNDDLKIRELVRQVIEIHSPEELFLIQEFNIKKIKKGPTQVGPLHDGIGISGDLLLPILWLIFSELIRETAKLTAAKCLNYVVEFWKKSVAGSATSADRANALNSLQQKLIEEGISHERAAVLASTILDVYLNDRPDRA